MSNKYEKMFQLFSGEEIATLRTGGKILHDCLQLMMERAKEGVTTMELDSWAEEFIRDRGGEPGFKGYHGFPATLCTSVNDACVHGIPKKDEVLKKGDIIGVDCGVLYGGLYTDACVTIPIGNISSDARRLLDVTKEALGAGISVVRAGVHIGEISEAVHSTLLKYKFDAMRQLTGHGLGSTLHQFPEIPNVKGMGRGPKLPPGTIIAIEPISTAGSTGLREDSDGWTLRTSDGSLSGHFEHTVLVLEGGCEILT